MPPAEEGLPLKREKIHIEWLKQTRHLPITAGNLNNPLLSCNNEMLEPYHKIKFYAGYLVSHKEVSDVEEEI